MRIVILAMFLASPALAHPAILTHSHAADWSVPFAFMLIAAAVVLSKRKAARGRRGQ